MSQQLQRAFRRRQWIVWPAYQWKLTALILTAILVSNLLTLSLVVYAAWDTLRDLELLQETIFVDFLRIVAWMVVVELAIIVPLVIADGIYLSHKIVGPLGRLKTALDQMSQGNVDIQLTLRRGDVLLGLAESINRLAAFLRARRSSQP